MTHGRDITVSTTNILFHQVLQYKYRLPTLYSTKSTPVEDRLLLVKDVLVDDQQDHVEDALVEDRLLLVEDALVDDQQDALLRGRPGGPRAKPA